MHIVCVICYLVIGPVGSELNTNKIETNTAIGLPGYSDIRLEAGCHQQVDTVIEGIHLEAARADIDLDLDRRCGLGLKHTESKNEDGFGTGRHRVAQGTQH
jgi:hypothetical protein